MANNSKISLRSQVIYSVYVRNHSREGTFAGVEKDLDRIHALGTDIIWFMPIHPIGVKGKKGALGCPYAIRDYREVNPEYGTLEDFKHLVDGIHRRGMRCIIDVVYNHTSPDSWLAEHHPDFFYRKPNGEMGNRCGDWQDVVDLDYAQKGLWDYQIATLKQWAGIVDGFRCDVASLVPLDFWLKAREEVERVRPGCLWLAESIDPGFLMYYRDRGLVALSDSEIFQAFDISYDYDVNGFYADYTQGKIPLSYYVDRLNQQEAIYPANYVKLRFLENHDNPRAGERVPDENALVNWTAFLYFEKGTTLIYAGQEMENVHTPSLFDIDQVEWNTGHDLTPLMKKCFRMKKHPLRLRGNYRLYADDRNDILTGIYEKDGEVLAGVFSLRAGTGDVGVPLADGSYTDLLSGGEVTVQNGVFHCAGKPTVFSGKKQEKTRDSTCG